MKLAGAWSFLAIAILILLISAFLLYLRYNKEGFASPVTDKRIKYEEIGKKMYNPFADTMDWFKIDGPIPLDGTGNKLLDGALNTATYEAGGTNKTVMDIRFDNPTKYKALPVDEFKPDVMRLVNMCESVKTWDCTKFDNQEFLNNCGICTSGGVDSKGVSFGKGGLYIDPVASRFILEEAKANGEAPQYIPTVGTCRPENFTIMRPDCDYRKHRADCAAAQTINDPAVVEKCLSCVNPPSGKPTFVFASTLGNAQSGYKLVAKPYIFTTNLRIVVSYKNAKLILTRDKTGEIIQGINTTTITRGESGEIIKSVTNEMEYIFVIPDTYENEPFTFLVEYPSFEPYTYTEADNSFMNDVISNDSSSLSANQKKESAEITVCTYENTRKYNTSSTDVYVYGCGTSKCCKKIPVDPTRRFAVVGQFESTINKLRQQAFDTAVTKINSLEVDTEKGPPRYGKVSSSSTFSKLVNQSNTKNMDGSRFWIWGPDNTATKAIFSFIVPVTFKEPTFSEDNSLCPTGPLISTSDAETRLRAGACDKLINSLEQKPGTYSDACIKSMFLQTGCTADGTGYPRTPELVEKMSYEQVPGKIIPSDLLSYLINLLPVLQNLPGVSWIASWTDEDVRKSYNKAESKDTWASDINSKLLIPNKLTFQAPLISSKKALNKNDIMAQVQARKDAADTPYTRGMNLDQYKSDNLYCYGRFDFNPCSGPNQDTGPHTIECLDYLFKNAGKNSNAIGPTYNQSSGRSSGTDRTAEKPILFCNKMGKMSPIDNKGNINMDAVQKANSVGGVGNVRNLYDSIHRRANYDLDKDTQYKAMNECYGLTYAKTQPCANGRTALDDPSKLPDGTLFKLVPSLSPGSNVVNLEGSLVTQSNIPVQVPVIQLFLAKVVDSSTGNIYILSRDGPPRMGYLVIEGFRVRIKEFQDNNNFIQNASWNVVDSIAGNPGEVSIESVGKKGFYMYFNQLDRTINISNDATPKGLEACSFAIM